MFKKKKVYIHTLGCGRRILDAKRIKKYCEKNGYKVTLDPESADYIIFNTCALDNTTENASIRIIEQFKNLKSQLIVAGCLPKINKKRLRKIFKGPIISPTNLERLDNIIPKKRISITQIDDQNQFYINPYPQYIEEQSRLKRKVKKIIYSISNTVRPLINQTALNKQETQHIRISWGCLGKCSYCAIRKAIGPLKSKPLSLCLKEFKNCLKMGYTNFEVMADDVGAYGLDIGLNFPFLLKKVLEVPGKYQLYLQDIHPRWLNLYEKSLKRLFLSDKIVKVGFPIQSASPKILSLMKRDTNIDKTKDILLFLKNKKPQLKIDTHIIIGFPRENENDLQLTLDFIKEVNFSKVWIYQFAAKINTDAASMPNQVKKGIIYERIKRAQKFFEENGIYYKMIWEIKDSNANEYRNK